MDKNQLRAKALEVFKNADNEVLIDLLQSTDQSRLPVAELDNFYRFIAQEESKPKPKEEQEPDLFGSEPEDPRKPSNISDSLKKFPEIDVFKSPKRETVTIVKKLEPFLMVGGSECKDMPTKSGQSEKYDGDIFAALFSGAGSLGVKSPKLPKQENEFPMGLKAFDSQLEPQENHSDEDVFN